VSDRHIMKIRIKVTYTKLHKYNTCRWMFNFYSLEVHFITVERLLIH